VKVHFEVRCRLCKDPATSLLCASCSKAAKLGAILGILSYLTGFPALESILSLIF
jgi:hypothetical protein